MGANKHKKIVMPKPLTNTPDLDSMHNYLATAVIDDVTKTMFSQMLAFISDLQHTVDHLTVQLARTDQYSRRGTVVVSGLAKSHDETSDSLVNVACEKISQLSGIKVEPSDIQAVHRNGDGNKESDNSDNSDNSANGSDRNLRSRNKSGVVTSAANSAKSSDSIPSITVRFHNLMKKDKVMGNIRNYNKPVKVTQSLTPYLRGVKKQIGKITKEKRPDLEVRFIHLKSSTAGLAVKLVNKGQPLDKKGWVHYTGIWCVHDFVEQLNKPRGEASG